jgi:N utilization substance protein B
MENDPDDLVRKLASDWTKGTWENLAQCDELIVASIIKWQLSRLSAVDKSILRLAVYQLKFCPDIPPRVVINEAIELAKKFSTDKSPAFVNGVLDAVLRKLEAKNY